jgi:hypothetical protein
VAVSVAALLGVLSAGAVLWVPLAVAPVLLSLRRWRPLAALAAGTTVLALPAIVAIPELLDVGAPQTLRSAAELGNLVRPLRFVQVLGIWPAGDFRTDAPPGAAVPLLAVAGMAVGIGVVWALRQRAYGLLAYVASALLGALALALFGSPWAAGKGLATASPALLSAAAAGCAWLFSRGRPRAGLAVATVLGAGVLWSNALAYRDAFLAPRERLAELASIGQHFAGQGPALMTEYEPYGVRHFLRRLDAEGASELRRRPVALRDGRLLEKGEYSDLDAFSPSAVLAYRTLVVRRSPSESRPPLSYSLVWRGRWYDVWQQLSGPTGDADSLPLGDVVQPGGVPDCASVRRLARLGSLVSVRREANVVAALSAGRRPSAWSASALGYVYPASGGRLELPVSVPRPGRYGIWVGGSVRGRLELRVDGRRVGSIERELNRAGQYLRLGGAELGAGPHVVELRVSTPTLAPGVGGPATGLGPLVLEPRQTDAVLAVPEAAARSLCGRRLDWIASAHG